MRSKLFVPGTRPELFEKALRGEADALSFDLEDSVAADGKGPARARLGEFLRSDMVQASSKKIIVRVNDLNSEYFADDVAMLADARVDLVNLPKCEDANCVHAAVAAIGDRRVLATIETPRGLAHAAEIAAHPAVAGLQIGLNDLFASLGIDRRRAEHVHAALWTMRLGAGASERFAMDGAWPDLTDEAGFCAEAGLARSMGYIGKSCIHPQQVGLANAIFRHDTASFDRARRVMAAAEAAAAAGRGAFTLDGVMIDRPAIDQARRLVAGKDGG